MLKVMDQIYAVSPLAAQPTPSQATPPQEPLTPPR
jgi:hypothetical protein